MKRIVLVFAISLALVGPAQSQVASPPAIADGGIVVANLLPTVNTVSPLSIISIFGQNFSTETVLYPTLDPDGRISTILGGTCLLMNGEPLPIFAITPGQINAQVSAEKVLGPASFTVETNCATIAAVRSGALVMEFPAERALTSEVAISTVEESTPAFFIFSPVASDGYIAARFNSDNVAVAPSGALVDQYGPSRPANPGDIIVLYGTGWGETTAALQTGQLATAAAEVLPAANRTVSWGGIVMDPSDVLYAGVTPQAAGLYQLAIRVPANAQAGNNQVVLTVYGKSTPVGPVVPVAGSQGEGIIVISQIYGGGGNAGAPLTNDFVELFNRGNASVNINGWTVQHASASGSTWDSTPLTGTILPGQYFLIQEGMGQSNTGAPLPTADVVGGVGLSAMSAKIALVKGLDLLDGSQPNDGRIVDVIGYGSNVSFLEGGPAPTLGNTTAGIRLGGGCTDTNNNAADFTEAVPAPRNSATALNPCN